MNYLGTRTAYSLEPAAAAAAVGADAGLGVVVCGATMFWTIGRVIVMVGWIVIVGNRVMFCGVIT
jgi:hypothetical protein